MNENYDYLNLKTRKKKQRMSLKRLITALACALALILSLGVVLDAHAGSMPSHGFSVGTVIGTKLKGQEQQDWSEGIFQVGDDKTWVYCVELMAHYNGSNVDEGDALGFISQDTLTRLALADEYIWTVTGEFSNNYQKYYMGQQAMWILLADEQGYASNLDWVQLQEAAQETFSMPKEELLLTLALMRGGGTEHGGHH